VVEKLFVFHMGDGDRAVWIVVAPAFANTRSGDDFA